MRKIVVAMDSLKGCLDSLSASEALAHGLQDAYGAAVEIVCVPVADGGEGTAEALAYGNEGYRRKTSMVTGPLGDPVEAEWYIDSESATACINLASAAGLALVDESRRNPLNTTTYGVGQLIMLAADSGASRILLGLGGSATVDSGLGACQAMGLRLLDSEGRELQSPFRGEMLKDVRDFQISGFLADNDSIELLLLCDVTAPFTGIDGASHVFGPQKGASPEDVCFLEEGMERVRQMMTEKLGFDPDVVAGTGAAGGAAGGLMAFAGGDIRRGASLLLDAIGFDRIIEGADLIITGEGSSDCQTLMGKLPYEILQRGHRRDIPVWLVAGRIADEKLLLKEGFSRTICINSNEISERSGTVGMNAMDADVAIRRLSSIMNPERPEW